MDFRCSELGSHERLRNKQTNKLLSWSFNQKVPPIMIMPREGRSKSPPSSPGFILYYRCSLVDLKRESSHIYQGCQPQWGHLFVSPQIEDPFQTFLSPSRRLTIKVTIVQVGVRPFFCRSLFFMLQNACHVFYLPTFKGETSPSEG